LKTEPEFRLTTATAMGSTPPRILRSIAPPNEPGAHLARCQGKAPAGKGRGGAPTGSRSSHGGSCGLVSSRAPRRSRHRPLRKRTGIMVAESQRPWEPLFDCPP
jgi:hypothetical protein